MVFNLKHFGRNLKSSFQKFGHQAQRGLNSVAKVSDKIARGSEKGFNAIVKGYKYIDKKAPIVGDLIDSFRDLPLVKQGEQLIGGTLRKSIVGINKGVQDVNRIAQQIDFKNKRKVAIEAPKQIVQQPPPTQNEVIDPGDLPLSDQM